MQFLESIFFVELDEYEDVQEEEGDEDGKEGKEDNKAEENGKEKESKKENGKEENGDEKKEEQEDGERKVKDDSLFGFNTVAERNVAFDKVIKHMKANYGTIYRSKGKRRTEKKH